MEQLRSFHRFSWLMGGSQLAEHKKRCVAVYAKVGGECAGNVVDARATTETAQSMSVAATPTMVAESTLALFKQRKRSSTIAVSREG